MDIAIDWRYWLIFPKVQEWEAVALSLGIDPESMRSHPAEGVYGINYGGAPIFADSSIPNRKVQAEFKKRRALLQASIFTTEFFPTARGQRGEPWQVPIRLAEFAEWSAHVGLDMTAELRALIEPRSPALPPDLFPASPVQVSAPNVEHAPSVAPGEVQLATSVATPPELPSKISVPGVKHKIVNRIQPLRAEIKFAMSTAIDSADAMAVWTVLGKLAETQYGSLIGFSSDGIQYMGKNYQANGTPDIFTFKNLRQRMTGSARA